jgi:hypothetical protein
MQEQPLLFSHKRGVQGEGMFLYVTSGGYDRHGQQKTAGAFLWVVLAPGFDFRKARAFVRHVKLEQCGHWMMGEIKVGKHTQTISGAYGADGLPDDASQHVWEQAVPIPAEIMETWAKSTSGHNGPGDEYHPIRRWANDNIEELRRAGRKL